MEAPQGLALGEQRDTAPQQHGGHLEDDMVHHIPVQQGSQQGVSADHPDLFLRAQACREAGHVAADGGKARLGERCVGEHIVFRGGVDRRGIPGALQLLKGPAAHQVYVHRGVKFRVAGFRRHSGLLKPVQTVVLVRKIPVHGHTAVKINAHNASRM